MRSIPMPGPAWATNRRSRNAGAIFAPYQVNAALMAARRLMRSFMHCLPAHRGEEVTDQVIDSLNSVVFDQAENRLHIQKAILVGCWAARRGPLPDRSAHA